LWGRTRYGWFEGRTRYAVIRARFAILATVARPSSPRSSPSALKSSGKRRNGLFSAHMRLSTFVRRNRWFRWRVLFRDLGEGHSWICLHGFDNRHCVAGAAGSARSLDWHAHPEWHDTTTEPAGSERGSTCRCVGLGGSERLRREKSLEPRVLDMGSDRCTAQPCKQFQQSAVR
jgi:hypothetical protein